MEKRNLSALLAYLGLESPPGDAVVADITIDSRTVSVGSLFVAVKGERFHGNDFIEEALARGAVAALTDRPALAGGQVFYAGDTKHALQAIAARYRAEFSPLVCGVTGSVGKTSTKDMTAAVLSQKFNTLKTNGNLNNELGLPLSVLRMASYHEAAVFEFGMSGFGEIAALSKIARPGIALITNIGVSHIAKLGSREGILKAKLEILEGLEPGGLLILNGDDPLLWEERGRLPVKTVYYGLHNPECDVAGRPVFADGEKTVLETPLFGGLTVNEAGLHNASNALAAAAVARAAGLDAARIAEGVASYRAGSSAMRQNIYEKNGIRIIEDCYNASPDSMRAAFSVLSAQSCEGKKIAVLGGMLELGSYAKEAHLEVGRLAASAADLLICYGENAEYYREGALEAGCGEALMAATHEEIAALLSGCAAPGDVILFKGSRGMKLEKAVALFTAG